jgi:hypothetical protein|tara:strand:+ start:880 stop:1347 length:468 start_codon:yes stop_codon:yes gene_type:complete
MNKQKVNKETQNKPELYTVLNTGRILYLTLKKNWFDMISNGIKHEEYREIKSYWATRLLVSQDGKKLNKIDSEDICEALKYAYNDSWDDDLLNTDGIVNYDKIVFKNGYSKDAPTLVFGYKGIIVGRGKLQWGAEKNSIYFKLQLGEKLFDSTEL